MKFSRPARQRMGLYGITRKDVQAVVEGPVDAHEDAKGNFVMTATVGGRRITVVLAYERPFVITVYPPGE